MSSISPSFIGMDPTWSRYRDNFPRHVLGVTRYLQSQIMERLTGEYGFQDLRLCYEPYISLIDPAGTRLTSLATALKISRQAANQTANQIEAAGYIHRIADPRDGRAKLIQLSEEGRRLRSRGMDVAARLQNEFGKVLGQEALEQCIEAMRALCQENCVTPPASTLQNWQHIELVGLLPRLSDYLNHQLMALTMARGHAGLKLSYAQVLALIAPEGGRILQIAALQNVSKQAISAVALELEELGYIYREQDPADARQVLLRFSGLGRGLIADSVKSIDELEGQMQGIIGSNGLANLRSALKKLYLALQPEVAVFTDSELNLEQLASELREKLTPEGLVRLVQLLNN